MVRKEAPGRFNPETLEADLAIPPEMSDTFVKEVDENLRRDRIRDFTRSNAVWLIGGLVLFLVLCGGLIFWHQHKTDDTQAQVEELAQVYASLDAGPSRTAASRLGDLADSDSKAVRAAALFGRAAVAVQQGDTKAAISQFGAIHDDDSLPAPYRDVALIRQTALQFDTLPPAEVVARLKPLATTDSPWFGSAGELTAIALLKEGKKTDAGQMFAAMARSKTVPDAIRSRAIQMASTLGIDASDALPAAPAQ